MVEKKEGAKMTCANCSSNLTCHEKRYPASDNYAEKVVMQWQNTDGSAHYSTKDGKNFNCNIPEEQDNDPVTPSIPRTVGDPSQESISSLSVKIDTLTGLCQSILHIVADLKIAQNDNEKEKNSS